MCWCRRFDYKWALHKLPSISPTPYAQAHSLMTPKESPGHIYESVCLNQITPSGRQSIPSGASVLSDCVQALMCWEEISRTASCCVSLCAALRWSHPRGVWMKTGEVPSSPRWVLSWGIITFFWNNSFNWNWSSSVVWVCVLISGRDNSTKKPAGLFSNSLLKHLFILCLSHMETCG